ncbi:MAG: hypothetical protein A3I77_04585 [Gammaproteobacteria bacterium RIFCSPLOWO2_02_FULL_42_14]|nr:MAG: hypothetical protein A3B71_05885 [Gammaproteobacteria bacterium RIFCSPHIGHO2_02_FULL_42_43]OGT51616.1 MAG: hypothetical protein A3E54_05650 [Gammaproteobacteria bacterium RIFCSPHIGHO2_12_FULL_41_25]OGT62316.1 MAG: hypothetical protein A3I77_04585 [Gammaproteobacteria bacterium RIFCSPLOWO2_02_FULL_42_14]OGT85990.1 MAG: hypothetical protein A3G86_04275 [Gammaproteobacteria bacterium RIFCSPLOWO2_12_FULL_42_18]
MRITFDPEKSLKNLRERNLPFDCVIDFEWETTLTCRDERRDYPEIRYIAIGYLSERLHVLCFTPIDSGIRVISFRRANKREIKRYEKEIKKKYTTEVITQAANQ